METEAMDRSFTLESRKLRDLMMISQAKLKFLGRCVDQIAEWGEEILESITLVGFGLIRQKDPIISPSNYHKNQLL